MSSTLSPIDRRSALKLISLGALAASSGVALSAATPSTPLPDYSNPEIYRFRIGKNDAFAIQCGAMEVNPTQPFFAAGAPADEFTAALHNLSQTGKLRLSYNVLLLSWNGAYVLIDTGEPGRDGAAAPLLDSLRTLGIAPGRISHVVLTHAHFDHLGGLLDHRDRPVFPLASHHALKAEEDFWTAPNPDVSKMLMPATDMVRMARRVFAKIGFHYATPGVEIVPGLTAFHTPGHTPGHMTLRLKDGTSTLYHIADLCHHAPFLMEHASWSIGSDVDPALAVRTRETVFQTLAETRERVFGFHLPFPGLGWITRSPTGFRWIAEDWAPGPS